MSASLAIQYVVVAIAVLLSAWVVLVRQFPHATRRMRIKVAASLLGDGRPTWKRSMARRIAPAASDARASACGGCDSCGPSAKS